MAMPIVSGNAWRLPHAAGLNPTVGAHSAYLMPPGQTTAMHIVSGNHLASALRGQT